MFTDETKNSIICAVIFTLVLLQLKAHTFIGMSKTVAIPVMAALACKISLESGDTGFTGSESDFKFFGLSIAVSYVTMLFLK
jgi:hypothetical protein